MKAWLKRAWAYLTAPSTAFLAVAWAVTLAVIAGALVCVFIGYTGWLSYPLYALAAITLAYAVYTLVLFAPKVKAGVRKRLQRREFTRALAENYTFRTLTFAVCSVVINLGFVVFNTVFAFLTDNIWYGALAGYYFLLSGLRVGVFYLDNRAQGEELRQIKNYRLCGVALFALDVAMAAAVTLMVLEQKPTKYTEITAIVFAAYSVYKISLAIWNIFKARHTQDWQIQSFRNIGLVDAAMSLLSLQTTLISTFSVDGESMALLNGLMGAFVCLFTIATGIVMMIRANKVLKEKAENEGK